MANWIEELQGAIDGAEYVRVFAASHVIVAWHGGCTFSVYDACTFGELDCWTLSNAEGEAVAPERARQSVEDRATEEGWS